VTMRAQLRSEFVKLRSTRTNLGLLAGMVGLVLLFVLLNGLRLSEGQLGTVHNQRGLFAFGVAGGFFAALIGVMSICSEFRHGTIRPTFMFTPVRGRVVVAKVFSSAALGVLFGLLTEVVAFVSSWAILDIRGVSVALTTRELLLIVAGSVAVTALLAALGVGFGAVVRNQVLAVIGLVVWFMLVENLLRSVAPSVGRLFPVEAGDSLSGLHSTDRLLSARQGALVLFAYVVSFCVVGLIVTKRSDVT
jgi:ABC-2 type transport system permease protein